MEDVWLDDIEDVDESQLSSSRLDMLENGYSSFEDVLQSSSDPITLDEAGPPYAIIDGQHRVFLARQKGYSTVPAQFE